MTLGKLVTGIRTVDEQGERPTLIRISVRTPCHLIPFKIFSVLFGAQGRGFTTASRRPGLSTATDRQEAWDARDRETRTFFSMRACLAC